MLHLILKVETKSFKNHFEHLISPIPQLIEENNAPLTIYQPYGCYFV
jgi:hypothetical protein